MISVQKRPNTKEEEPLNKQRMTTGTLIMGDTLKSVVTEKLEEDNNFNSSGDEAEVESINLSMNAERKNRIQNRTSIKQIPVKSRENSQLLKKLIFGTSFKKVLPLGLTSSNTVIKRSISNYYKLGYFGDDERDEASRVKINNRFFYYKHQVSFSMSQYVYFLFLHIIYYGIFGPFIAIPACCSIRMKNLMWNLLITRPGVSFYAQNYYWICSILIYFAFYMKMDVGDLPMMHTLVISLFLRSCTIAGKYATFKQQQIRRYYEEKISIKDLNKELMMYDWLQQKPEIIDNEIKNSLKRSEIDKATLKLSFIENLSDKVLTEIERIGNGKMYENDQILIEVGEESKSKDIKKTKYYDGRMIFHYLTDIFNKKNSVGRLYMLWLFILSCIYGVFPGFLRINRNKNFHGKDGGEITIFYFTAVGNCFLIFTTAMFYQLAVRDLSHKRFMLEQFGHMISPMKLRKLSNNKHIPTINIIDPISLSTWISLRKTCLDYGLKFFFRHQLFMPVMFLVAMISVITAFAVFYLSRSNSDLVTDQLVDLVYYLLLDFILMFFMFFKMLYRSADINKQFDLHNEILKSNKEFLKGLLRFREYYFRDYLITNEEVSTTKKFYHMNFVFEKKSTSYLHRRMVKEIMTISNQSDNDQGESILKELISMFDEFIEELENHKEYESLKILGFVVNNSSVRNLWIGFISILATSYEIMLSGS